MSASRNVRRIQPSSAPELGLRRGRIERLSARGGADIVLDEGNTRASAQLTLAASGAQPGDAALCAIADDGVWYVVAVVPAVWPRTTGSAPRSRRLDDAVLRVERQPGSNRSVIRLPEGAIDFVARGDVAWSTEGAMHIDAREGVTLSAGDTSVAASEPAGARLRLDADRAELRATHVETSAERIDVVARRVSVAADVIDTTAGVLRRAADVIETDAERILERAGSSYREVRDLAQTRAGRLRTIVEQTATTLVDRFVLAARADVRIDGERIHLG